MNVVGFIADFKFGGVGLQIAHNGNHAVGKFLRGGMGAVFANAGIIQPDDELNIGILFFNSRKYSRIGQAHHFQRLDVSFTDELVIGFFKLNIVAAVQPDPHGATGRRRFRFMCFDDFNGWFG